MFSLVAASPSINATGSPGMRSSVSMTTKITPSSTGMVSSSRRTTKISIAQTGAGTATGRGWRRRGPGTPGAPVGPLRHRAATPGVAAGGERVTEPRRVRGESATGPAARGRAGTRRLLVEPGLPEAEVVFDRVDDETLDAGFRKDDLLGVVDRKPARILRQDFLNLRVHLLPLRLVQAPPCPFQKLVHARIGEVGPVPARRLH